jgi:hypothetical protein
MRGPQEDYPSGLLELGQAYNKSVATYSDLIAQMTEIRKWLAGGYGSLPAGVTLLIKPADYEHAVLKGLSEVALIIRARALLGDARRVINELLVEHPDEARLINNLTTYSSALSDMLRNLEKRT